MDQAALEAAASPAHLAWLSGRNRWAYPRWLQYLNEYVTDFLLDPRSRFLAVEVPVRHGKSSYLSINVPAWYVGMFPDRQVLLTTYSDDLSRGFGRQAREVLEVHGPELFGVKVRWDARASNNWKLEGHNGGMRSVSRGGTITGTGGDLIIIDDPVKDDEEAQSKPMRDRLYNWYRLTLRNRLEPGGKIILVMSRWHEDDLTGRLVDHQNIEGDRWERIHLPALAEPMPAELKAAEEAGDPIDLEAWTDILGRHQGEALWPERWPAWVLRRARAAVGPLGWASNFQQMPVTPGGDIFPKEKWKTIDALPRRVDLVRRWDLADNDGGGDFAAGSLLGRDHKGFTFVVDVRRKRAGAHDVEEFIKATAREDRRRYGKVHIVVEQEPGSAGKTVADNYVRDHLAGYDVEAKPTSRAKILNAMPLSAQQQAGNVYIVRVPSDAGGFVDPPWYDEFVDEAALFPRGANDDQIDTASQAFNDLVERARKRRKNRSQVSSAAGRQI